MGWANFDEHESNASLIVGSRKFIFDLYDSFFLLSVCFALALSYLKCDEGGLPWKLELLQLTVFVSLEHLLHFRIARLFATLKLFRFHSEPDVVELFSKMK